MAWIKRNLFFVIGLAVAVLLLAAAVVYDLQSLNHNTAAKLLLDEVYDNLGKLNNGKDNQYLSPDGTIDNIQAAKDQAGEIRAWRDKAETYFKPITAIPNTRRVTSEAFAADLRRTIDLLQREATAAGVELPPKYSFSFEAQHSTVRFAPGSLEPLAEQLGEVKTISEILFAARINSLDSVQRARVSEDDAAGPQADYVSDAAVTNDLAVLTPCAVTFRSFSGELAMVLAAFASSPHGFIVKGIGVTPAVQAASAAMGGQPPAPAPPAMAGRGGLPTVLNEKLLRVTLEIEIVKLR